MGPTHPAWSHLGLKPGHQRQLLAVGAGRAPWRITAVERGRVSLLGLDQAAAHVDRTAAVGEAPLAVGDWVLLDSAGQVEVVLDRATLLRRGVDGRPGSAQLMASNLDTVFVVAAFAPTAKLERRALNPRRLQRFVMGTTEGGARAVLVLNKRDVTFRSEDEVAELQASLSRRLGGVEVVCVSALEPGGLEPLSRHLGRGETVAFIGLSGVGKSTLVNQLLGEQRLDVGDIRARDVKGRHTTTRRQMLQMPTGALLVDTPGVRAFAVVLDDDPAAFDDIEALAASCRFADCRHQAEPGCAVRDAVTRGELSPERLAGQQELRAGAARVRSREDPRAQVEARRAARRFGKAVKEAKAAKRR